MSNVFEVGDVVYHPFYGKVIILSINAEYMAIDTEIGNYLLRVDEVKKFLSFTPWPAPNHVRPLKNGVYKAKQCGMDTVLIRWEGRWYYVDSKWTTQLGEKVRSQEEITDSEFLYSLPL